MGGSLESFAVEPPPPTLPEPSRNPATPVVVQRKWLSWECRIRLFEQDLWVFSLLIFVGRRHKKNAAVVFQKKSEVW